MAVSTQDEQRLALFIDFENIAIGVRDAHYRKFDINLVLERLLDKGKLLSKKAYADWSRYSDYKRSFHEAAIELIEVPQKSVGGKNSADIRLVVDAMDMSFQKEHINCFVVCSGDSDFSPLVSKLKENNKYVIGLGVKNSTSELLIENCDEFIFYEDLVRVQQRPMPVLAGGALPEKLQDCFNLLVDSVSALAAREQGGALGLHGQGDHEAQEALLQRDLLRLPLLLAPARGRAAAGHRDPAPRPEVGQLHHRGPRGGGGGEDGRRRPPAEPVGRAQGRGRGGRRTVRERRALAPAAARARRPRSRRTGAPAAPGALPEAGSAGADDADEDVDDDSEDSGSAEEPEASHAPAEPREAPARAGGALVLLALRLAQAGRRGQEGDVAALRPRAG